MDQEDNEMNIFQRDLTQITINAATVVPMNVVVGVVVVIQEVAP